MAWINDYKPTNYGMSFDVADGDHRIKITKAREDMTKTQKPMIVVEYAVQGSNGVPFVDRIVSGEYFDSNMTRFFDAFKIDRGNFNFSTWIGKEATAHFEHRVSEFMDQNGQTKTVNRAEMTRLHTPNSVPQTAPAPVQNDYADFKEDIPGGVF